MDQQNLQGLVFYGFTEKHCEKTQWKVNENKKSINKSPKIIIFNSFKYSCTHKCRIILHHVLVSSCQIIGIALEITFLGPRKYFTLSTISFVPNPQIVQNVISSRMWTGMTRSLVPQQAWK